MELVPSVSSEVQNRPLVESFFAVDATVGEWMRTIRRHIHRFPELSYREEETGRYVIERLKEIGVNRVRQLAPTGIVAEFGADTGPLVCLRCDMDALPLQEDTGLEFSSSREGIMHACGHDGHMAMLLGAACLLRKLDLKGRVRLLFQPAEESGNGAVKMIDQGCLDEVEAIFCGHIDTHHRTGLITVDEGIICASADPFSIRVTGRGGHAARPHEAADALVAAASLVTTLQTLVSREKDPNHAAVITIGKLQAGDSHNIIAREALLEGTVRSTHAETRKQTLKGLRRIVDSLAVMYGVETELEFHHGLPAVLNSQPATSLAAKAAQAIVGRQHVISQGPSSLGSEDFSNYQHHVDGCMVRFGAEPGNHAGPAHSNNFDFDEEVLPIGAAWYAAVAWEFLRTGPR
ncbi:MAG: M20 family metallopeptidase [Thermodesulfobacteriota bacterium]